MQALNKSVLLRAFLTISIVTASSSPYDEEHKPKLVKIHHSKNSDQAINFMGIRKILQKSKAVRGALRLNTLLDEKDERLQADIRHEWSSSLEKSTGSEACQKVNYLMDFSKYQKKSGVHNESIKEARYPHQPPPFKPPPPPPKPWWGPGPSSWYEYEEYEDYDDYWWYSEIEDFVVEGVRTFVVYHFTEIT